MQTVCVPSPRKICNMCGKEFDFWDEQGDFGFSYDVGYGSNYDGEHLEAHFCCACFDRIYTGLLVAAAVPMEERKIMIHNMEDDEYVQES